MIGTELGRLEYCLRLQPPLLQELEEGVSALLSLPRLDELDHGHALPDRIPRSYSLAKLLVVGRSLQAAHSYAKDPLLRERVRRALRVWEEAGMDAAVEESDSMRVKATHQEHDTLRVAGAIYPQEETVGKKARCAEYVRVRRMIR